jgi:hypothetical protein
VFSEPYVALADDGTIWVTVPLASEVRAYSPAGRLLRTIGAREVPGVDLKRPSGLAFRPTDGRLLVSDIDAQVAVIDVGARPLASPSPSPASRTRARGPQTPSPPPGNGAPRDHAKRAVP